jgi:TM2 domain-containing membrane protein YozV
MEENKKDNVIGVAEPVVDEVENIGVINPDILKKKAAAAEEAKEEVVEEIKLEQQQQTQQTNQNTNTSQSSNNTNSRTLSDYENKRILAGIMGVLFGAYGVHNFIYGYTTKGIIQILMSTILAIFTCGLSAIAAYIWGLVEGILILTDQIKPNK